MERNGILDFGNIANIEVLIKTIIYFEKIQKTREFFVEVL